MGTSADPGRAGPTRPPDRRLDGLGDPERGGHRSGTTPLRPAPGASSSPPRPRASSRQTSSTSTPRSADACTRWRSSNTAPDACTSPASPPTRHGTGPCSRPGTSPPTSERAWSPCASCCATATASTARRSTPSSRPRNYDVIKSAPQAPRMNAHCERIIGTIRREVLDHVLIMGEAHARQVLATYQEHYNEHRPHQARDQLPPEAQEHPRRGTRPRHPPSAAHPDPRRTHQRVQIRRMTCSDDFSSGTSRRRRVGLRPQRKGPRRQRQRQRRHRRPTVRPSEGKCPSGDAERRGPAASTRNSYAPREPVPRVVPEQGGPYGPWPRRPSHLGRLRRPSLLSVPPRPPRSALRSGRVRRSRARTPR